MTKLNVLLTRRPYKPVPKYKLLSGVKEAEEEIARLLRLIHRMTITGNLLLEALKAQPNLKHYNHEIIQEMEPLYGANTGYFPVKTQEMRTIHELTITYKL